MIFVTVGTHDQGFDRLIEKCDQIADQIDENIIMQIGASKYIPRNAEYFDFSDYEDILRLIKKARIVITHDGAGSILNCLINQKPTIVVPRLKIFNECKYNNKLDLALELERLGKIYLVKDIKNLNMNLILNMKIKQNFEIKNTLLTNMIKYIY